jgi:CRP/FNR family transcriptional regulator, cyclic AMP receptor protein
MAKMLDPIAIGELPLFHGLPSEQLAWLAGLLHHKTFPPGANLITAEQPGEVAYIILSGTVKIHMEQADGADVIIAFGGPGDIEGEMSLLDNVERSANVVTQEATTVLWMDRAQFHECLRTIPSMTYNLVRILSGRLRLANARIQALCALDVQGRLARQIMAFAQEYGRTSPNGAIHIPLRLTQSDLASLVGASRERINQIMTFYKQRGYLAVDRNHHVTVHDADALAKQYR